MSEGRHGSLRVSGSEIRYVQQGSGPAVLLLHAGVADRRMWRSQLDALAPRYRVIAPDARGFGASVQGPERFSYVDDILALLDQLEVDRAAIVACSSFGTPSVHIALHHPERVRALALVGAWVKGFAPTAQEPEIYREAEAAEAQGDKGRLLPLEEQIWLAGLRRSPEEIPRHLRDLYREMNEANWQARNPEAEEQDLPSDIDRLGEIGCPTLVLTGEEDTPEVLELAEVLHARIPGAEAHRLPGTAHLPPMEVPHAFNGVLLDWLRRLP